MHKIDYMKKIASNKKAVMGLPLRLTVCLIIGSASLLFILSFILNPCIFPEKITVDVEPIIHTLPLEKNKETFAIKVKVTDSNNRPVYNANVIIKGLGEVKNKKTNYKGFANFNITPKLAENKYEGYMDLIVKSPCKETFFQSKMIKIVRGKTA